MVLSGDFAARILVSVVEVLWKIDEKMCCEKDLERKFDYILMTFYRY